MIVHNIIHNNEIINDWYNEGEPIHKMMGGGMVVYQRYKITHQPPTPPTPTPIYRWVLVDDEFLCSGTTKCEELKKQVSYDDGATWEDVIPLTYKAGAVIEEQSEDCGYTPEPTEGYLAIIPSGNGSIQLSGTSNTFQYSFNSGATWNNATSATSITMNDGVPLWFKGTLTVDTGKGIGKFKASTDFDVEGNPASLIYGEYFSGKTTVPKYAFYDLFQLQPVINASGMTITAVGNNSYKWMFSNCHKLVSVPKIQLSTMAIRCFYGMFDGCTALTNVPTDMLTATTLASECYYEMFRNCASLTVAPKLPATTLAKGCYRGMFLMCLSLNSITCLATYVSATDCTKEWVIGVAANGTFTKASGFLGWSQGIDGIPNGWTVQDA